MARKFSAEELAARASGKLPRPRDSAKRAERQDRWKRFGEALELYSGLEAKRIISVVLRDRGNPKFSEALDISERITRRMLLPELLEPTPPEELEEGEISEDEAKNDQADRARLAELIRELSHPDLVEARKAKHKELRKRAQWEEANLGPRARPEDVEGMLGSPVFMEWLDLKYALCKFFTRTLAFMAEDPNGQKELKAFLASNAGRRSGQNRSESKKKFQQWATEFLKNAPTTSIGSLPERYVREKGSNISVVTLRKYLTPSGGFDDPR